MSHAFVGRTVPEHMYCTLCGKPASDPCHEEDAATERRKHEALCGINNPIGAEPCNCKLSLHWQAIDYRVRNWIINILLHPTATGLYRNHLAIPEWEREERVRAARAAIAVLET